MHIAQSKIKKVNQSAMQAYLTQDSPSPRRKAAMTYISIFKMRQQR